MLSAYERERRPSAEFKRNSLSDDLCYIRQNFAQEGLPANWFDLPGTGFMINTHLGFLSSALSDEYDPSKRKENLHSWLRQTDSEIRGFSLEYLAEGLVFPISYKIGWIDGDRSIINTFHGGGKKLVDTVSAKERNGVVKQTIQEILEPFFLEAPDGSLAFMTSPCGWSGLQDENGKEIMFPDSQTYVWQKRGNEITGVGIRTDFSYDEHRSLIQKLSGKVLGNTAPVDEYVSSVALFDGNQKIVEIEDVVNIMRDVRFATSGGSLFAYKERMWQEVYEDLQIRDRLFQFDEKVTEFINDFAHYAKTEPWTDQSLKEALAVTILRISKIIRGEKIVPKTIQERVKENRFRYGPLLLDMQQLPGCAGGGRKTSTLIESLSVRLGIDNETEWSYTSGLCVSCGAQGVAVGPCNICRTCEKKGSSN